MILLLLPFSFFLFFRSPAFFASGPAIFFCGSPRGEASWRSKSIRLTGCQVDPSASIRWLGGPNTRRENDSCVYTDLAHWIFFFLLLLDWKRKRERYLPTSFIPTQVLQPDFSSWPSAIGVTGDCVSQQKTDPSVVTGICALVGSTFVKLLQRFSIRMRNFLTFPCAYIKGFSSSSSPAAYLFVHVGSCVRWPRYFLTILLFFPITSSFLFCQ